MTTCAMFTDFVILGILKKVRSFRMRTEGLGCHPQPEAYCSEDEEKLWVAFATDQELKG